MSDEKQAEPTPEVWAIVSLMGHKQYAGKLSEVERFGGKLGRIDVIDGEKFRTVEFNSGSVYSIEYVSEEAARIAARRSMPKPVESWELPKQLAPAVPTAVAADFRSEREDAGLDNSDIDDDDSEIDIDTLGRY